jgi:DNA-binding XRE family transcriptional regulator
MVADDCIDHELRRTYREDDDYMNLSDRNPIPTLPEPSERIRLRELFGTTQSEVAEHIKVTRQMVNRYENGRSEPTGATRILYAELLTAWSNTEHERMGDSDLDITGR